MTSEILHEVTGELVCMRNSGLSLRKKSLTISEITYKKTSELNPASLEVDLNTKIVRNILPLRKFFVSLFTISLLFSAFELLRLRFSPGQTWMHVLVFLTTFSAFYIWDFNIYAK